MPLEINRKGMLLVLSGPAGAGKGTLGKRLLQHDPDFYFSVSATTREPRFNEKEGVDYLFVSDKKFDELLSANEFLEHATVHGHRYGTLRKPITDRIDKGVNVLLDIDTQGAMSVIKAFSNCISVFILPPSFGILEERLHTRNTEDPVEIAKRLKNARAEVEKVSSYNYAIVNDSRKVAFEQLLTIVNAEKQNTKRFLPTLTD